MPAYSQEPIKVETTEEQDLSKIYDKIKKLKKEGIEIHYQKETIIKDGVEDERGYLKHLLSELESALKKGKKIAKINRVEGDLVEIDKGAIHKVVDRDVYIVYDSSGKYKGKVEIGAIADAISIGRSYEIKKKKQLYHGDNIKFRGNRKPMEIGIWGGGSRITRGNSRFNTDLLGMSFKYILKGGWGFEVLLANLERNVYKFDNGNYDSEKASFQTPIGIRKYFFYPSAISPYIGIGGSQFKGRYNLTSVAYRDDRIAPYFNIGIQNPAFPLHFDLGVMYFHGPKITFSGENFTERPVVGYFSMAMAW